MILQSLNSYYDRLKKEGDPRVSAMGFQHKAIPFVITIDRKGNFRGITDTRGEDGQARRYLVPHEVKRSVNISANLLWDNPSYVLGIPKQDPSKSPDKLLKRADLQHKAFLERIKDIPGLSEDEDVAAVLKFLARKDFTRMRKHPLWQEIEQKGPFISFQMEGAKKLICQKKSVINAIENALDEVEGGNRQCLVSGELGNPKQLHTAIKGIWGCKSTGGNIVSFNLRSFESHGWKKGLNAPIGARAEFAYTTVLNALLARGSRQKIQVGDASTVFWAEKKHAMESIFADIFGLPPEGKSDQDDAAVRSLFKSPRTGAPPLEGDLTRFFVLGLAPNAARISIRFWYEGTVGEVAKAIGQHFKDCSIIHSDRQPEHLSLFRLLISTAIAGDAENIQPNLAGDMMRSILNGTPYPSNLLSSVVRRVRAEQSARDSNGNSIPNVNYPRSALIKGILVRRLRYFNRKGKEVGMALDKNNDNVGYLLGRLFAVLERIQEAGNPGINKTIRETFYGGACGAPVTVFPRLLRMEKHHIAKIESAGLKIFFEKLLGEIMGKLNDFPDHLDLSDQGRFAIGYYHQRQDFYKKKGEPERAKEASDE